jgi:hypothetical protein
MTCIFPLHHHFSRKGLLNKQKFHFKPPVSVAKLKTACTTKLNSEVTLQNVSMEILLHLIPIIFFKPGTFGHRWQPMMIWLDLKIGIRYPMVRLTSVSGGIGSPMPTLPLAGIGLQIG